MRKILLDTETTGLNPHDGHRIIEIGCVELVNRKLTGNNFHYYLNPEREIDAGAQKVHGLSTEFLQDKPKFNEIVLDFIEFIKDAEVIIHNAPFDVGFINAEFERAKRRRFLNNYCQITDTLAIAKKKFPGQKNNLDALCKRFDICNEHRTLHGALLDASILADVYLALTGGQSKLALSLLQTESALKNKQKNYKNVPVIKPTDEELAAHAQFLKLFS